MRLYGYSYKVEPSQCCGKPSWHAKVRRKGWQRGYWVTVSSGYGAIEYTSPTFAVEAAHWWARRNEGAS